MTVSFEDLLLDIEKPVLGGYGLARHDGMAVFVAGALPGQRMRARFTRRKARHAWAEQIEILSQSPEFTPPECPHFGVCGGCDWLHMRYDRQLFWKRKLVDETLFHLGEAVVEAAPTIPSPVVDGYRNKMDFAFAPPACHGESRPLAGSFVLGLRPRGESLRAVPVEACRLCPTEMIRVRRFVEQWAQNSGLSAYDPRTGQGFWRHLTLRTGHPAPDILAVLVTAPHPRAADIGRELAEQLMTRHPQVRSLVHETRKKRALPARGGRAVFSLGPGRTMHEMGHVQLIVSSRSFFQSNTPAARELYEVVRDFAALAAGETLWDLYSGVGGIALSLARGARQGGWTCRSIGLEDSAEAVRDALANARRNNLETSRFVSGDVFSILATIPELDPAGSAYSRPDVIVADPPRGGMSPKVIDRLLAIRAPRLILVSCNPASLARDLKLLRPGYALGRVQPVDMFPHTSHIECVVELSAQ